MRLLWITLLLLFPFINADSMLDFNVTNPLQWDQPFTMQGIFVPTTGTAENRLCTFIIYESNRRIALRLSDEYTIGNGFFTSSPTVLREPVFDRNADYNAVARCGTNAYAERTFHIDNRKSIENRVFFELSWLFTADNIIVILITGLILFGAIVFYNIWRKS